MIQEFDNVVLTVDLPQFGLASGDIGTIVMLHASGKGYEAVGRVSSVGWADEGSPTFGGTMTASHGGFNVTLAGDVGLHCIQPNLPLTRPTEQVARRAQ